jgi:hypothetical protein
VDFLLQKLRRRTSIMSRKERVNKAQDKALERLDYVIDYRETPDFVEVTGRMGGDTKRIST